MSSSKNAAILGAYKKRSHSKKFRLHGKNGSFVEGPDAYHKERSLQGHLIPKGCTGSKNKGRKQQELIQKKLLPDLPDCIIYRILTTLDVTTLYAMSRVLGRFRDAWRFCRDVCFDDEFSKKVPPDSLEAIINDIIMGHSGIAARSFQLHYTHYADGSFDLCNKWLDRVFTLGFEEISLSFSQKLPAFNLGDGIPPSDKLRILHLSSCHPNFQQLPPNSLPNLQVLTLQHIYPTQEIIDSALKCSSSLQSFQLIECEICSVGGFFVFNAQNLERLKEIFLDNIYKCFMYCWIDSPSLNLLRFRNREDKHVQLRIGPPALKEAAARATICKLEDYPPNFTRETVVSGDHLMVSKFTIADYRGGLEQREWVYSLCRVEEFCLRVGPMGFIDLPTIALFLCRCPMIRSVSIDVDAKAIVYHGDFAGMWIPRVMNSGGKFQHLNYVKISGIKEEGRDAYEMFVEFLLIMSTNELRDVVLQVAEEEPPRFRGFKKWDWLKELADAKSINLILN